MEPDDSELIERTLDGAREAFATLLERHGPVLWAAVRRRVDDPEEARDVYQDAVLRGFERLGRLRDPERLRSWWLSIALNGARSRARRSLPEPLGERPPPERGSAPPASAALEREEQAARVRAEVERLTPRQREVCRLRWVDGLSHGAIAELLGISADNSRAHVHQALKRLRERLAEDER